MYRLVAADSRKAGDGRFLEILGIFDPFSDRFLHFFCLTQSMSYHSVLIANNYQGREAECAATFGSFHYPVDSNHFVFQFQVSCLYPVQDYF